jgi:uncharacterized protein YecT (DUF1311 family)
MIIELLFSLAAQASNFDEYPACKKVQSASAPQKDQPSKDELASLKGCDALGPSDGVAQAVDYKKARLCAFAQLQNGDEMFWGGRTILYMIYANGHGVSRNLDLALKYACEEQAAPAEIQARIKHIESLKQNPEAKLDYCDDITSGYAMGFCAGRKAEAEAAQRKLKYAQLPFKGPKYDALVKAAEVFRKERSQNEVDLSGTARSMFVVQEESIQDRDFYESLEAFSRNKAPKFALKKENAELNKAFKKILTAKDTSLWGTVTKDGIIKTQKAWVAYRNAWRTFAGPEKADLVDAWFTKKRTHMLKSILGER